MKQDGKIITKESLLRRLNKDALKKYPLQEVYLEKIDGLYDVNHIAREAYKEGYRNALKDIV